LTPAVSVWMSVFQQHLFLIFKNHQLGVQVCGAVMWRKPCVCICAFTPESFIELTKGPFASLAAVSTDAQPMSLRAICLGFGVFTQATHHNHL